MKVERVDHIHVAVRDFNKAIAFFESVLGTRFSPHVDFGIDDKGNDVSMRTAIDPLGLEVFAPTSETSAIQRYIDQRGEGLNAICFKVDDLEAAIKRFEERGVRLGGRVTLGNLKEAQFHPNDCFGFMIELCEYQDKSPTYVALTSEPTAE